MKKLVAVLAAVCILLCGFAQAEQMRIIAANFPCYDFARQVAGEAADVTLLIRPGMEVHTFEPTTADMLAVSGADLFVYIGGQDDAWADGILKSLGSDAPQTVALMDSVAGCAAEAHDHEHAHDHDEPEWDEHIWTSPKNAVKMVRLLEEAMCAAAPEKSELFRENADEYAAQIEAIDAELTEIVNSAVRRKLVFADRFPFIYMARDYGIEYEAAFSSCASDTEPSVQTLVRLMDVVKGESIPAVYTIEMSTGNIARMLAEETGVEILTLHSAQTVTQQEFDAGETYVTLMRSNLEAIRRGLNG